MIDRRLDLIEHEGLQALVAVPERSAGAPLLCFLHGNGEAAPADIQRALTKFGPLCARAPTDLVEQFVVVIPQLPHAGDIWHTRADPVRSLVLSLQARYGTDPARRYLTGFSYGGNGTFDLALVQPHFWAALWAVDPARRPAPELPEPVWLSIGSIVRFHKEDFIERLRSQPAEQAPFGDRVHLDEGEDHTGCAELAYADNRIYEWLLAHSRAP